VDALEHAALRGGVGDESGKTDPHVWLDPVMFAAVVRRIGDALHERARADRLESALMRVDREYRAGLGRCARREFVTSHAAFGYLAARYRLRQIPITGIDPEAEPSARHLARLANLIRREHITTVFFETLVSPKISKTLAREAGVTAAVLDPIEGLTPAEARRGENYLSVMRRNLRALRTALGCR
jgi:zinc transport system substrate-binding protein